MNWYKIAALEDESRGQDLDCPECGAKLVFVSDSRYGPYYKCEMACGVTHGAWPDGRPKGIPGDLETMSLRKSAHAKFDQLWKNEADPKEARTKAYAWLAHKMGCHKNQCHMAQFDKTQLRRAMGYCENVLNQKRVREQQSEQQPELF